MNAMSLPKEILPDIPDISHIITEDDEPVDNIFSEKQQRLLTRSLNSSWNPGFPFLAAANVGIFYAIRQPPVVPDMFLSLDVQVAEDIWEKKNRSYFIWEYGKPPEVVIEIVSNREGGETDIKFRKYARAGIWYYLIFDPQRMVQKDTLRIYELAAGKYIPKVDRGLHHLNLSVTLWEGVFEGRHDLWLRWCDKEGNIFQTGEERAKVEQKRAETAELGLEKERLRAENAETELEKERFRSQQLEEKLRALGIAF